MHIFVYDSKFQINQLFIIIIIIKVMCKHSADGYILPTKG